MALVSRSCLYLFFCIAVLPGCSSPGDNAIKPLPENNTSTSVPKEDTSLKIEKGGVHSFTVEIKKMKFTPEEITVQKGDTVIWVNNDLVAHCITEEKTKAWTSSVVQPGSSWKKAVAQSAAYYCAIHQVMKGKIMVQ